GADPRNAAGGCAAGGFAAAGAAGRDDAPRLPAGARAPQRGARPDEPGAAGAVLPGRGELDLLRREVADRAEPQRRRRRRTCPRPGPARVESAMSLSERWSAALAELRARGRHRELTAPAGIDFTSNDYLGYAGARAAPRGLAAADLPRSGMAS